MNSTVVIAGTATAIGSITTLLSRALHERTCRQRCRELSRRDHVRCLPVGSRVADVRGSAIFIEVARHRHRTGEFPVAGPDVSEPDGHDPASVAMGAVAADARLEEAFRQLHNSGYVRVIAHLRGHGAALQDAMDAGRNAFKPAWQEMHEPRKWAAIENPALWITVV
jgi:hypothetical protein